ncbi:MAG: tRNA uridine-5-carboxymethylaminomethyl(34) synthesis GTPase MnmE [Pseudomonadota bacterium]
MVGASETIVALSSGTPPAAIGIIRVSGPRARVALSQLTGREFVPREARLAKLRDDGGALLDEALVLYFQGPSSATGEDLVELHCHGGRAVLAAVERALVAMPGIRAASPGEFTRRAFANGRIDLAQAEGLADLLSAETELHRAAALANTSGALSAQISAWRDEVLRLSAQIEAVLDFSDEEDASDLPTGFAESIGTLVQNMEEWLVRPRAERLGEGYRVVLAGPPNSGKSTLFNALVESEAAITSPVAGTTRDVLERSVAIAGVPLCFVDTAGLRETDDDEIEAIGIGRAKEQMVAADLTLWLGEEGHGPRDSWEIAAREDAPDFAAKRSPRFTLSAATGSGMECFKMALVEQARSSLPKPGEAALNARQHALVSETAAALLRARAPSDLLLIAEELRSARASFDRLLGRATTEDMLDALFGRFCIGK